MEEPKVQRIGSSKRRIPQQISVPFLWDEKPGMARTQWPLPPQPDLLMLLPPPPPPPVVPCRPPPPPPPGAPAKFIVSIPFKWEEKPGTPIRSFARDPSLAPKNKNLPLPPAYYSQFFEYFDDSDQESSFDEDMDPDWLTELDRDASSSGPSLLANRLVPATTISSAVPYEASSSYSSSFPDDDDSSSDSYETGNTSPVGNSLEQLFPLYAAKPNSVKTEPRSKGVAWSGERSMVFGRPQTLGDLIMLSRRRSYMQKAAGIAKKTSVSKEFEDPNGIGCFALGSGKGGIASLLGGKSFLSLKFV